MTWPRFRCFLALFLAAAAGLPAQNARDLADLDLTKLAEIPIVSAARHEQSRRGSPRSVSVISSEEIRRRNYRSVPEAVGNVAGVYLQQTNYGGGSPIIRGMVGNRILLMVNSIRMNNATYRLGPNQYLNYIDIDQVERIEVIRGAGSVLYGSDAFGGVINVITRSAPDPRSGTELSGSTRVRFGTANASGAGRVEMSGAAHGIGFLAGFSESEFGDLHAGGSRGLQRFTGYGQSAGDLNLTMSLGEKKTMTTGFSRMKQFGVDRTDLLQSGADLVHQWNPQGRDQMYVRYEQEGLSRFAQSLQATMSFARPFEDLTRVVATAPLVERRLVDRVSTAALGVQMTAAAGSAHVFTYGADVASDWIDSTRQDVDLRTGRSSAKPGNYVDGSRFASLAFFVQDEIRLTNRLDAVFGARYDRFQLRAESNDPAVGGFAVNSDPSALNGSAHFLYRLNRTFSAVVGASQGFRAPNVDDSTIIGGSGSRFEIPNATLKPERSINMEYGVRAEGRAGNVGFVFFNDRYRDFIDRGPALLNGLPFLDRNYNGVRDANEEEIFQRQNINSAQVSGVELDAMFNLADGWTWTQYVTWTRGTDTGLGQPLTRIPPLNGASRLTWQSRRLLWAEGALIAASAQHRLAPADKTDVRIGPEGTAGYTVVHLRAGLRQTFLSGLSVALENVTNRRYRFHGSGLDRPGVNLIISYVRAF